MSGAWASTFPSACREIADGRRVADSTGDPRQSFVGTTRNCAFHLAALARQCAPLRSVRSCGATEVTVSFAPADCAIPSA